MLVNMSAQLLFRHRQDFDDGAILEAILWKVTEPIGGGSHSYKYRLYYGYPGRRVVGYDNERGKGDHRHLQGREERYEFTGPEQLFDDFLADVAAARGER